MTESLNTDPIKFYGRENVYTSGNPKISFFDTRTNYHSNLNQTLEKNKLVSHTHFVMHNVKYFANSLCHKINLNKLFDDNYHHLLGGVCITIYGENNMESLENIVLSIDEAMFEFNLDKLGFLNKFAKHSMFYKNDTDKYVVIDLPIELFKNPQTWINLISAPEINLNITFLKETSIRCDFKIAQLDYEEKRNLDLKYYFSSNIYTNPISDVPIIHHELKEVKLENNLMKIDLSDQRFGIKSLAWTYVVDGHFIPLEEKYIDNAVLRVKDEKNFLNFEQDSHQLLCTNHINTYHTIIRGLSIFPISLNPNNYHPSGDFFLNDSCTTLLISTKFEEEILKLGLNCQLLINHTRILRYYVDKSGKTRCKFCTITEAFESYNTSENYEN